LPHKVRDDQPLLLDERCAIATTAQHRESAAYTLARSRWLLKPGFALPEEIRAAAKIARNGERYYALNWTGNAQ
jgi:hypothetical protein